MTLSKRLALLGVRSAVSASRSRGVGSPYGLIDRRPFPYRQMSEFTNDSKNSQMETLEDDSSPELIESIKNENILRNLVEKDRAVVEKMRTEQAKAGYIYRPPTRVRPNRYANPLNSEHLQFTAIHPETIKFKAKMWKMHVQLEKKRKLLAELEELRMMRMDLITFKSEIAFEKTLKDFIDNNIVSEEIRKLTASVESTKTGIHIVGTATVLLVQVFLCFCVFGI